MGAVSPFSGRNEDRGIFYRPQQENGDLRPWAALGALRGTRDIRGPKKGAGIFGIWKADRHIISDNEKDIGGTQRAGRLYKIGKYPDFSDALKKGENFKVCCLPLSE